jgi:hypothetical protein
MPYMCALHFNLKPQGYKFRSSHTVIILEIAFVIHYLKETTIDDRDHENPERLR